MITYHRYCINCEEVITHDSLADKSTYDDFCSQKCADEYLSNADERVLLLARESNPDALPVTDSAIKSARTNSGHLTRPIDGSLPPSTLEAVQSLLRIGGVTPETIDNVINIDRANTEIANNKELTPREQEFVKNDPTNE